MGTATWTRMSPTASLSAAGLFLLVSLALGIAALGLPVWAGFGIVTSSAAQMRVADVTLQRDREQCTNFQAAMRKYHHGCGSWPAV